MFSREPLKYFPTLLVYPMGLHYLYLLRVDCDNTICIVLPTPRLSSLLSS